MNLGFNKRELRELESIRKQYGVEVFVLTHLIWNSKAKCSEPLRLKNDELMIKHVRKTGKFNPKWKELKREFLK